MSSDQYINYGTEQFNSQNVPILGSSQLFYQNNFNGHTKRDLFILYLIEFSCTTVSSIFYANYALASCVILLVQTGMLFVNLNIQTKIIILTYRILIGIRAIIYAVFVGLCIYTGIKKPMYFIGCGLFFLSLILTYFSTLVIYKHYNVDRVVENINVEHLV